jgi:hypothetical protein
MDNIVLYCKSYRNDVDRVKLLLDSINKYNVDSIPFYVSVPSSDIKLFEDRVGKEGYTLVPDETIDADGIGWAGQQVIKAQFWKLGTAKNYLCLDSDSQFIKPFYVTDFIYEGDIPYTVCHEQKDFFEWTQKNLSFDPQQSFIKDRKQVMEVFQREGRIYDFGPSPVIWNADVWRGLDENYTKPNNLTFADLIKFCPSEFTWYGEYLLQSKAIPIYPTQPLFKVFHYGEQYVQSKQQGYSLEDISKNYLGVILQSNWGAPLQY